MTDMTDATRPRTARPRTTVTRPLLINHCEVVALHRDYSASLGIGGDLDMATILVRDHKGEFIVARWQVGTDEWFWADFGAGSHYPAALERYGRRIAEIAGDWT